MNPSIMLDSCSEKHNALYTLCHWPPLRLQWLISHNVRILIVLNPKVHDFAFYQHYRTCATYLEEKEEEEDDEDEEDVEKENNTKIIIKVS